MAAGDDREGAYTEGRNRSTIESRVVKEADWIFSAYPTAVSSGLGSRSG